MIADVGRTEVAIRQSRTECKMMQERPAPGQNRIFQPSGRLGQQTRGAAGSNMAEAGFATK